MPTSHEEAPKTYAAQDIQVSETAEGDPLNPCSLCPHSHSHSRQLTCRLEEKVLREQNVPIIGWWVQLLPPGTMMVRVTRDWVNQVPFAENGCPDALGAPLWTLPWSLAAWTRLLPPHSAEAR